MGLASIIRALGAGIFFLGIAMGIPGLFSLSGVSETISSDAGTGTSVWFFALLATTLTGGGLFLASGTLRPPTDFRGGILLVLLWWVIAPVFAALPIYLGGVGFSDSYFEAVSAITTTGAWLSLETLLNDPVHMLWRAILQWSGGLVSIAFAASIIVRPAFYGVKTLQLPFSRGERDSYLRSLRNALRSFLSIYCLLTLACFGILVISGIETFDAVILSFSVPASGGLIPHIDGMAGYPPWLGSVLMPFILFSGINFILLSTIIRGSWRNLQDNETEVFVIMIFAVGILFWVLAGAGDIDLIPAQLFNSVSLLTTNGMILGEAPPLTVAVITSLIGGAAVSTAGGFKIQRWLVIMARAREEIRRLILPHAVHGQTKIANELGVWMHFLVFTLVLAIMILVMTFSGHSFDEAASVATATLSNTGPLIALSGLENSDYGVFSMPTRWFMVVAMILGRIEAVAALALFNRAFWRS